MRAQFEERVFVCTHVFQRSRPIILVSRPEGDWCFLCGDMHQDNASAYRSVGLSHILEADPTVSDVLDLPRDWEAERATINDSWVRTPIMSS